MRAVCAALVSALVLAAGALAVSSAHRTTALRVVASHLNNPRKIFVDSRGSVFVVEAGTGGRDKCVASGSSKDCIGLSGAITRIAGGAQTRAVTGLWSAARSNGQQAEGPADVLVRGGRFVVLLQDATIDSRGANSLGPDGAMAGDLVTTPAGRAKPTVIFDAAAYEAAHNPDGGAGSGARFGNPAIDSNPYAFTAFRGGYAVVDAAANDLLLVDAGGKVSVLAVFPTRTVPLTSAVRATIGAPASMGAIVVQAVPSSVAVGPDGALYVGELTGVPFKAGLARVWRIVPGEKPTVYASGFTTISDLGFDGRSLLVLELSTKGLLAGRSPGALIRVSPGGARRVLASRGLLYPTGLAVGEHSIYVSNYGLFPGTGPGPHGQLVSLPRR